MQGSLQAKRREIYRALIKRVVISPKSIRVEGNKSGGNSGGRNRWCRGPDVDGIHQRRQAIIWVLTKWRRGRDSARCSSIVKHFRRDHLNPYGAGARHRWFLPLRERARSERRRPSTTGQMRAPRGLRSGDAGGVSVLDRGPFRLRGLTAACQTPHRFLSRPTTWRRSSS